MDFHIDNLSFNIFLCTCACMLHKDRCKNPKSIKSNQERNKDLIFFRFLHTV